MYTNILKIELSTIENWRAWYVPGERTVDK